jgi:hypothetical protein
MLVQDTVTGRVEGVDAPEPGVRRQAHSIPGRLSTLLKIPPELVEHGVGHRVASPGRNAS